MRVCRRFRQCVAVEWGGVGIGVTVQSKVVFVFLVIINLFVFYGGLRGSVPKKNMPSNQSGPPSTH